MSFILDCCSEKIFIELDLPDWLRKSTDSPIDKSIVYDLDKKITLIPNAFDHGTYPDRSFSLFIDGKHLSVWEKISDEGRPFIFSLAYIIKVWVSEDTKYLEDSFLKELIQQAFFTFYKSKINIVSIIVEGREKPITEKIKLTRTPQEIILAINDAIDNLPDVNLDAMVSLLIPIFVKPQELEEFLKFGAASSWSGLSSRARNILQQELQKINSNS